MMRLLSKENRLNCVGLLIVGGNKSMANFVRNWNTMEMQYLRSVTNLNTIRMLETHKKNAWVYQMCNDREEHEWLKKFVQHLLDEYYHSSGNDQKRVYFLNGVLYDMHPYDVGEYYRQIWEFCTEMPPEIGGHPFQNRCFSMKYMLHDINWIESIDVIADQSAMKVLSDVFAFETKEGGTIDNGHEWSV